MKIITLDKEDLLKGLLAICVLVKIALYYHFMEVTSNYILIMTMSFAYVAMVFFVFENKIYSAIIYFIISVIMLMDAAYFSYFNRSLSIDMIEAFGFLDNVSDSVFEVVKPKFLLLLLDAILIFFVVLKKKEHNFKGTYNGINYNNTFKHLKTFFMIGIMSLIIIFVSSPTQGEISVSIVNQEFFSYHISDFTNYMEDEQETCYLESFDQIKKAYADTTSQEWFGIGKGKNLIVIQVESLQDFVINKRYNGQVITPFLNQLIQKDSFYFPNYYQQLGSGNTSDAEFVTHNSLYASFKSYTYSIYDDSYFRGLPWILREQGYCTAAFHGYEKDFWSRADAYSAQGFNRYYSQEDYNLDEYVGMGLSDRSFFNQSIEHIKAIPQPFYGFMVTLSSHHPYWMLEKDKEIMLKPEVETSIFGNYIQAANYFDQCLEAFIDELKKNNLYEDTVIAIYGDHFGLNCKDKEINKDVSDFLGVPYCYDEMMNIPLIIHVPESNANETIETVGGQIDFLPTVGYLMGFEQLDTLFFGQNLIHADEGFVASQTYMLKGSFIQDGIAFEMSRDGIFSNSKAWDLKNKRPVELELCEEGYKRAVNDVNLGNFLLENDALKKIYQDGQTLEEILGFSDHLYQDNMLIVEGGGKIKGYTRTNSLEALEQSYNAGYKYIEIDIEWTSDREPVLLHDWDETMERLYRQRKKRYDVKSFKKMKMIKGLTPLTLADAMSWAENHPDVYFITNAAKGNVDLLEIIKEEYPHVMHQIIPQVYYFEEYPKVEYLGYQNIIFKVSGPAYQVNEILDFVELNQIFALAIPFRHMETYNDFLKVKNKNIYIYYTEEEINEKKLIRKGVDGFYIKKLNS